MTVTCIRCSNLNLRDCHLGKLGLGICKVDKGPKGKTFSAHFPRDCAKFSPATQEVVARREAALNPKQEPA